MKKIHLIIAATAFLTMSCSQKKSSPLDYWKAGSANDDVFIEMTQEEMDALAKNDLPYLEIDWPYSAKKTQDDALQLKADYEEKLQKANVKADEIILAEEIRQKKSMRKQCLRHRRRRTE